MAIDPEMMTRLGTLARDDQRLAAMRDYIACEQPWHRWPLLALVVGRTPTDADWRRCEALRAGLRRTDSAEWEAGDIAAMTGLTPATLYTMVQRREMPAPSRYGPTWRWARVDIADWLARRGLD